MDTYKNVGGCDVGFFSLIDWLVGLKGFFVLVFSEFLPNHSQLKNNEMLCLISVGSSHKSCLK